jgi:ferric-dicitrate binding protein FerR (iron transport regulator)
VSAHDPRQVPSPEQVATTYRQLADAYSKERAQANHERTWQRIELKASIKRKSSVSPWARTRLRWAGWSLAAAAAVCLAVLLVLPNRGRLEYALDGGSVEQGWIVTAAQAAHVSFTDGSELRLGADSALSVASLGPHSALSRLARGTVHVEVKHHDDTRWTFLAGPFEVRVEGTAFDLTWRAEQFAVKMHEGRVRVVGPDHREWVLEKGDELVVPPSDVASDRVDVARSLPKANSETVAGRSAGALGVEQAAAPAPDAASAALDVEPRAAVGSKTSTDWGKLLKQGRFSEIVLEAKQAGIPHTLRSRSVGEVEALAQAARYISDAALAEECWKGIRGRAPGSSAARQGAFFLGRVMEQQGRSAEAIQWFARYREESPTGVYAGQALGRQMVLTSGQGRSSVARELATVYLDRFSNGPYAKAARGVLGVPASGIESGN